MHALKFLAGILAALVVMTAATAARAPVPMLKFENVPVQSLDGKPLTLEQVRKAVVQGGALHKWLASQRPGNVVRLTYSRGRFGAIVDVAYSQKAYSIRYVDSTELEYVAGSDMIHPTYNNWMKNLKDAIDAALRAA